MPKVMLDSGAYSAWTRGLEIDLDRYIEFCQAEAPNVWAPVGLDVLPGRKGLERTARQTEEAARSTYVNLKIMRRAGVAGVVPVFHQGERLEWLRRYVEDGFEYIGISPNKSTSNKKKIAWLDEVFEFLCGDAGYPPVKLHAFGETAHSILFRYPWYSCDSTSWSIPASMGWVFVPPPKMDGTYDWKKPWFMLPVSTGGKKGKGVLSGASYKRYESMGPLRRDYLDGYFRYLGFEPEEVRAETEVRLAVHIRYYNKVVESFERKPFFRQRSTIFGRKFKSVGVSEYRFGDRPHFIFASGSSRTQILIDEGVSHCLLSYADVGFNRRFKLSSMKDKPRFRPIGETK